MYLLQLVSLFSFWIYRPRSGINLSISSVKCKCEKIETCRNPPTHAVQSGAPFTPKSCLTVQEGVFEGEDLYIPETFL